MGLDVRTAEFLLHAKRIGVDFGKVATLGHQRVMLSLSERKTVAKWLDSNDAGEQEYADAFLRKLGARQTYSIDASRYEGAEIIHNLNTALPEELHEKFSCLIDGGTLEHVFDIRQSLKSCMQMVEVGGHLIVCQMANNCMGHGLYQFSPEFFYCAFTEENGYRVKFMAINEDGDWYEPLPPQKVRERIQARTRHETYIFVVAERISDAVPFETPPHQSDYVDNLDVVPESKSPAIAAHAAQSKLRALRKKLGKFKREFVYGSMPWLSRFEERIERNRYLKLDTLKNERRFRTIGRRLYSLGVVMGSALVADIQEFIGLAYVVG